MLHINKGRGHIFEKIDEGSCHDYCISIAWDWCFVGHTETGIKAEMKHIANVCEVTDNLNGVSPRTNNTIHAMLLHACKITKGMTLTGKEKSVSEACAKNITKFLKEEETNLGKKRFGRKEIKNTIITLSGQQYDFEQNPNKNGYFEKHCDHKCRVCSMELYNSFLFCSNCEKGQNNEVCYKCVENETSKSKNKESWCRCKTFEEINISRCIRILKLQEIQELNSEIQKLNSEIQGRK